MTTKRTFRVMVALSLASAAGRKKLNGIHRFLSEGYDWDMELIRNESDFTAAALSSASRSRFDGILIGFAGKCELRALHADRNLPTVFIDHPNAKAIEKLPLCMFVNDDEKDIAQSAAKHLMSCPGVRSFGFVPSRTPTRWSHDREAAFASALHGRAVSTKPHSGGAFIERALPSAAGVGTASGRAVSTKPPLSIYDGPGDSREALGKWLQGLEKPAAVLAAFDDRARDVLEACRANGIEVPGHLSVLGIGNDEPICEMSVPPLSSVGVDFEREGYSAARELQAMMLRRRVPARREVLCGVKEVVFRASTSAMKTPAALVQRAKEFIDKHALEGITAADVVARLHVSRSLADLRFREVTGTSILEAILERRLGEVKRLLRDTDLRIAEVAARCGYRDANYLKNLFRSRFGCTMRDWRRKSEGLSPQG